MLISGFSPPTPRLSFSPERSAGSPLWQGDHFTLSSGSRRPAKILGFSAAGAAGGGALAYHVASGLSGTAARVASSLGGATAVGLGAALVGGILGGRQEGFGGLAAGMGYACVGGVAGGLGGALWGARAGAATGCALVAAGGALAGGLGGLFLALGNN